MQRTGMKRSHCHTPPPPVYVRCDIPPFPEQESQESRVTNGNRSDSPEVDQFLQEPVCKKPAGAASTFSNVVKWLSRTSTVLANHISSDRVVVKPANSGEEIVENGKSEATASGGSSGINKPSTRNYGVERARAQQRMVRELTGVGATLHMYREQMRGDREVLARGGSPHCADIYCRYTSIQSGMKDDNPVASSSNTSDGTGSTDGMVAGYTGCVALDCEMVGVGARMISAVGRVSIVSYNGEIIFDRYVRPRGVITDYRTRYSGIRPLHMKHAITYDYCREKVMEILRSKLVVGHALSNDFEVLDLRIPRHLVRDTSHYVNLRHRAKFNPHQPASLKRFAKQLLGKTIQTRSLSHCSVEDARVSMELYRIVEVEWERHVAMTGAAAGASNGIVGTEKPTGTEMVPTTTKDVSNNVSDEPAEQQKYKKRRVELSTNTTPMTEADMSVYLQDDYWLEKN